MAKSTDRSDYPQNEAIKGDSDQELQQLDEAGLGTDLEQLTDLEAELGMQEIYLDEAELDAIPADQPGNDWDRDDDGIQDNIEEDVNPEPMVDSRPQELTESYGTGLQGYPTDRTGRYSRWGESHLQNESDAVLTGGDVDANYEQAAVVGDEAVGGTVATPDQDVVDELANAVGIEMDDRSFLRTNDMLEKRDDRRWELDPKSSEDYDDRRG